MRIRIFPKMWNYPYNMLEKCYFLIYCIQIDCFNFTVRCVIILIFCTDPIYTVSQVNK